MAYFIPSSIQKRLLRYALSRLEFLDTDALDLKNLDIGWGRNSTIELKDVSLRKQKLASLLQLPDRLTIQEARVTLLRVTVPTDLHAAPVVVDIQGIDARARLSEEEAREPAEAKGGRQTGQHQGQRQTRPKRTKAPSKQSRRKYSNNFEDEHGLEVLPSTRDLAASFLAEEPEEEEQLQAAINSQTASSQSTDLRQSVASSDSGDDGLAYGTGVGLSLPAFLADFLKGIVDRLQVMVSKISIKIDADFDPMLEENSRFSTTGNLSEATIGVFIESVKVSQTDHTAIESNIEKEYDNRKSTSEDEISLTVEKRCVVICGIHGSLLSDAATFAQLSQIFDKAPDVNSATQGPKDSTVQAIVGHEAEPESPITPLQPHRETIYDNALHSASQTSSLNSVAVASIPEPTTRVDTEQRPASFLRTESDHPKIVESPILTAQHDIPANIKEGPSRPHNASETSETSALEDSLVSPLDSSGDPSFLSHNALSRFREKRSLIEHEAQSMPDLENYPWNNVEAGRPSASLQPSTKVGSTLQYETDQFFPPDFPQIPRTSSDTLDESDEDMAESRLFSHAEAESIYMSALHELGDENSAQLEIPDGGKAGSSLQDPTDSLTSENVENELRRKSTEFEEHRGPLPPLTNSPHGVDSSGESLVTGVVEGNTQSVKPSVIPESPSPGDKLSVRPLFSISECRICLPLSNTKDSENLGTETSQEAPRAPTNLTGSDYRAVPGAFSVHSESRTSILKEVEKSGQPPPRVDPKARSFDAEESGMSWIEVSLGKFRARTDTFTIRLLNYLVRKLQAVFQDHGAGVSQGGQREVERTQKTSSAPNGLSITLNAFEIAFVDVVADKTYERSAVPNPESIVFDSPSEKVLFTLRLGGIDMRTSNLESMIPLRIEVDKLNFGFHDEDIISCNRETGLRTSLRDMREIRDKDLSLEIGLVKDTREINIATQPVKISINLQKLDNTLGSMGGLSSLLELGSSIMSDTTIVSPTPKPQQRSRTVHFDPSISPPLDRNQDTHVRVNVKVSGAYVTVRGVTCKVACQSSAIKVVARNALIGAQVDDLRFSGPHIGLTGEKAPLLIRVRDTRLKYLFVPEEHDITRLISLLTPSKDKFEEDDDFLVDTLVRQRKKGAVLRLAVSSFELDCDDLSAIDSLKELGIEASKMSVTRFLPKETRPGLLSLALVDSIRLNLQTGIKLGCLSLNFDTTEVAHVTAPWLTALAIRKIAIANEMNEKLLTAVVPENCNADQPMLMSRMIEDELEPTVKIKLWNACFEYSVPTLLAILNREESTTIGKDVVDDLSASITAITDKPKFKKSSTQSSDSSENSRPDSKSLKLDLALRECAIGLKPRKMPSKLLFVMTDIQILTALPSIHGFALQVEIRKAGLLLTNNVEKLTTGDDAHVASGDPIRDTSVSQVDSLCRQGYVSVTSISAASISVKSRNGMNDERNTVEVDFQDKLFVLETCADSTQTLIETLSDLSPPTPPSKDQKYRTEVAPVEDMMASFTGDAFALREKDSVALAHDEEGEEYEDDWAADFEALGDVQSADLDLLSDDVEGDITGGLGDLDDLSDRGIHISTPKQKSTIESISGTFAPDSLPPQVQGTASKWDSANNRYLQVKKAELRDSPFKLRVTDTHIIWNLYDGYDWEQTRDAITKAVHDVEIKAAERRKGKRTSLEDDEDDESVIGDFLFNSIYVGVPINHDPKDLSRRINRNIDDLVSETGSHTPSHTQSHTSTATSRPAASPRIKSHGRRLKLERSRRHKIAFELRGVSVDFFVFPPGEETQSSTDVRIEDFEIFDHVPTSTWKKFATYMHDAGPREDNKPMLHLEICDVRPVPELTAAELVLRVTVLPLRLHVDQDALDFLTRFFEFHDDNKMTEGPQAEQPYLQRVEVRPVPVKLDYKPKKVDYAGLRSGRSTEFMNFFILDGAEFILKHVIVYGTSGFTKLHRSLEDVWMPDVKKNQLPSVLSGLNGVRTFVNVGTGFRDLVAIPIREYKKDGRIVRSISKGATAFVRTTGSELTRFGAKVAVGAQNALQGAEGLFVQQTQPHDASWEEIDMEPEEKRATSHYANAPAGILQGLKGAARSLERDLLLTRDVIVAISGEVRESNSAEGAALAVARHAPTLILRPMIGATKAISQTLMGATNTVDPQNKRRLDDKYKRY